MSVAGNRTAAPKGGHPVQVAAWRQRHAGQPTRAVVYLRVSTVEQAERGLGLKVQQAACVELAEAEGFEVVAVHADEGVSGAEQLDARDGLVSAIDMLQSEQADVLVVYRLDRLARDLIMQETLLQRVWAAGALILSCSAAETELARLDDGEDPARTLVRQILAAVAAYERSMIRLRMRGGRRRAARERVFAGGIPPFGWEPDKTTPMGLREVWLEQATIQRAARLHEVDGLSWPEVAAQLNAEGMYRREARAWDAQSVRRAVAADQRVRDEAREKRIG
ncbi:MAG: hypothetical protein RL134_2554 [Actinomycetota bacterium]